MAILKGTVVGKTIEAQMADEKILGYSHVKTIW
jgi:hypothetical protein